MSKKKLLLADDSETIRRVIQLTFADEDIDVAAVEDGRLAIERLERDPPDIVLADIGMPQHDGYEVAEYVKTHPHLAHIPVILLSGAFDPIDEARAKAVRCDGVMAKPFEPQQVITRVRQLLSGAGSAEQAPFMPPKRDATGGLLDDFSFQAPPAPPGAPPAGSLDEYFDRLDQDLGGATKGPDASGQPAPPGASGTPPGPHIDWLPQPAKPATPPAPAGDDWAFKTSDAPGPAASIPPDRFPPGSNDAAEAPTMTQPRPAELERPASGPPPATYAGPDPAAGGAPSIADAFAALLAAEEGAPAPPPQFGAAPLSDEMIDLIVARVLERMTGDTVSDVVTRVAERLVREEIEKIKNTR